MKQKDLLGPLEQLVLTAVLSLGQNAYSITIYEAVCNLGGREISPGTVSVTLARLEDKRYLASKLGGPVPEGGRPKRYYKLRPAGERALREAFETSKRLQQTAESTWSVEWPGQIPDPEPD